MKSSLLLCIASLLLSSCSTQHYLYGAEIPIRYKPAASIAGKDNFFVGGLDQTSVKKAAEICGGSENLLQISTQTSFADGILSFFSSGIYTPNSYWIYCR